MLHAVCLKSQNLAMILRKDLPYSNTELTKELVKQVSGSEKEKGDGVWRRFRSRRKRYSCRAGGGGRGVGTVPGSQAREVVRCGGGAQTADREAGPPPPGARRSGRVAGAAVELAAVRGGLVAPASSCLPQGAQLGTAVRKAPLPPSQASGSL